MCKKLILPLASIISLIVFIALSCAPSVNGEPEGIAGSISYENINGSVNSSISAIPSSNIIPPAANVAYSIDPELPAGLTLDPSTGEIDGTPEAESASTSYVVTASGTGNYTGKIDSDPFSISIGARLSNPMDISSNSSIGYENITGTVGTDLTISPSKSIVPSDAIVTYSIEPTTLPDGLNFNPETGGIAGKPLAESAPTDYMVTVTATAPYTGSVSSNSFTIVIVGEQSISGSTLNYSDITGTTEILLSITPTSSIPEDATVAYTVDPAFLPDGLILNPDSGVISGIPSTVFSQTTFQVTATATAPYTGMVESNEFTIAVKMPITGSVSYEAITGPAGSGFSASPSTSFVPDTATVEYSIVPELPEGLSFESRTGEIAGNPRAVSASTRYVVSASGTGNYTGKIDSDPFTIEVTEAMKTLITGMLTYANSSTDASERISISPTDTFPEDAAVTYSLVPTTLPENVMFNSGTGVIEGTSNQAFASTAFRVTATATETGIYAGTVQSDPFTIEVTKISITTGTLSYGNSLTNVGIFLSLEPTLSTDQAAATFTYSISSGSLPDWLTLYPATGIIEGIPNQAFASTAFQVTATATETGIYVGTVESDPFTIEVTPISIMGTLSYDDFSGVIGISTTTVSLAPTTDTISPAEAVSSFTYAVTSGSLPSELTFDPNNGTISGTLNEAVNVVLQITATAGGIYEGNAVSNEFNIVITEQLMGTISYGDGGSYTFYFDPAVANLLDIGPTLSVTPAEAVSSLTYAVTSGSFPGNLSLLSNGFINGYPATKGVYTFRITATAGGIYGGSVTSDEFTIMVKGEEERVSINSSDASMTYGGNNEISFNTGTRKFAPVLTGDKFMEAHAAGKLSFRTVVLTMVGNVEIMAPFTLEDGISIENDGTLSLDPNVMTTPSASPSYVRFTIVATGEGLYKGQVTQRIRLENLNLQ